MTRHARKIAGVLFIPSALSGCSFFNSEIIKVVAEAHRQMVNVLRPWLFAAEQGRKAYAGKLPASSFQL